MARPTETTPFGRGLFKRTVLLTVGRFVSKLMVFFMVRLYTACLSPAEYSAADLIADMANLLIPLASLGVSEGIFRNAADRARDKETYLTAGLFLLGGGSLLFLCLSPLLTCIPLFSETAWLIVLYVLLSNIHSVVSQYLFAIGRVRLFAGQGILNTALLIGLNILFLPVLKLGVTGYIMSTFIADGLTTLFLVLYTRLWRSVKRLPRRELWDTVRGLLRFCLPLVPATLCWWITSVSDRYMIYYMRSAAENGLYTAAYKIPTILTLAVSIFSTAWKGSISAEEDDPVLWSRHYTYSWRGYTAVAFFGGGCLILVSRVLANILYADAYRGAWVYIPVLIVATLLCGLDTFLDSVYFTARRTTWSMISALTGAVLNILLNALWIPEHGALGASVATLSSYLAVLILRLITTRRLIGFRQAPLRLGGNILLLSAEAALMTAAGEGYLSPLPGYAAAGACLAGLIALNARPLLQLLNRLLHRSHSCADGKETSEDI